MESPETCLVNCGTGTCDGFKSFCDHNFDVCLDCSNACAPDIRYEHEEAFCKHHCSCYLQGIETTTLTTTTYKLPASTGLDQNNNFKKGNFGINLGVILAIFVPLAFIVLIAIIVYYVVKEKKKREDDDEVNGMEEGNMGRHTDAGTGMIPSGRSSLQQSQHSIPDGDGDGALVMPTAQGEQAVQTEDSGIVDPTGDFGASDAEQTTARLELSNDDSEEEIGNHAEQPSGPSMENPMEGPDERSTLLKKPIQESAATANNRKGRHSDGAANTESGSDDGYNETEAIMNNQRIAGDEGRDRVRHPRPDDDGRLLSKDLDYNRVPEGDRHGSVIEHPSLLPEASTSGDHSSLQDEIRQGEDHYGFLARAQGAEDGSSVQTQSISLHGDVHSM